MTNTWVFEAVAHQGLVHRTQVYKALLQHKQQRALRPKANAFVAFWEGWVADASFGFVIKRCIGCKFSHTHCNYGGRACSRWWAAAATAAATAAAA